MLPKEIKELIDEFCQFPGVGPKTAERYVFYLLKKSQSDIETLSQKIKKLKEQIKCCSVCFHWDTSDPCSVCSDQKRDQSAICVVAYSQEIPIIEKTKEYNGLYHVLEGVLKPTEGVTPDKLTVTNLTQRIKTAKVPIKEVILALNPDTEGEATIFYLVKLLKPLGVKITRLAKGLPNGSDLEYADEVTLSSALLGRREI